MFKEAIISSLIISNLITGGAEEDVKKENIVQGSEKPAIVQEITGWQAQEGDRFEVNVAKNIGYLIHLNGDRLEFEVLTGQQHNVCYMRRCYFGGTPIREWEVKSMDIKADRNTFGPQGKFLRMYKDGESSPYGIHGNKYYQQMLNSDNHYRSYGCILVSEEILDIIEQAYKINGDYLKVKTVWEL